ncbi:enoyl-CoA hydratase [Bordetella trematum]|uniref:3-hydroxyisobutyryl-CoA hydrolase n=1 Tax=Bordetella trematum TaxID=123899 RepID=A0A157LNT4_9BORD|nr:enoyl-CoA hydratase/isomerase family protein [Bordetella trematum]AUL46942.1 enoyl-CoA hydratase [Bordetella trematum]AZR93743.1 enoyl-CoA hydratase [Bordetella trematum]NNH21433.1 enoyl-CoA hydratase/isomerase family protein [Bordetella trematum]QIM72321.1 enoyl-CoA hydratase/isomerase family protein [Bordetella trematum]SAH98290.1 enoly-CoA hydratase [Bordetella trematum]
MQEPVVKFSTIPAGQDKFFGVATLNVPASLNALSMQMVRDMTPQLRAWQADASIAGVLLDAAGEKAFCAGGDMRQLYDTLLEVGGARNEYAERFFGEEYELDHLLHNYGKPLLCWGHGIVMGGGVGLLVGASHRVVTDGTRLAMPEINIGLYPDVGGTWFLGRAPGKTGLFLGLTAAIINATDAIFTGLADFYVPHQDKAAVLDAIAAQTWSASAQDNHAILSRLLLDAGSQATQPPSRLLEHYDTINALFAGDDLLDIAQRMRTFQCEDKWLQGAVTAFNKGAPSSIVLTWELLRRCKRMSLAEVFRVEYWASLGCCAQADLAEGIRAVLVDKDRNPAWNPSTIEAVSPAYIEDHFRARGDMAPEIAHLR